MDIIFIQTGLKMSYGTETKYALFHRYIVSSLHNTAFIRN